MKLMRRFARRSASTNRSGRRSSGSHFRTANTRWRFITSLPLARRRATWAASYDGEHYAYRTDEKQMLADLEAERARLQKVGEKVALENLDNPLVRLYRRSRAEGFGPEVKRRIMLGTYALSAGYYDAYYKKGPASPPPDPPGFRSGVWRKSI